MLDLDNYSDRQYIGYVSQALGETSGNVRIIVNCLEEGPVESLFSLFRGARKLAPDRLFIEMIGEHAVISRLLSRFEKDQVKRYESITEWTNVG